MMLTVPPSWPALDDLLSMTVFFYLADLELLWSMFVLRRFGVAVLLMISVGGVV